MTSDISGFYTQCKCKQSAHVLMEVIQLWWTYIFLISLTVSAKCAAPPSGMSTRNEMQIKVLQKCQRDIGIDECEERPSHF